MHGVLSLVHPTHGKCAEEQGLVRMCVDKRSAALATTNCGGVERRSLVV